MIAPANRFHRPAGLEELNALSPFLQVRQSPSGVDAGGIEISVPQNAGQSHQVIVVFQVAIHVTKP